MRVVKPLWCGDFERSREVAWMSAMFELSNFITYISIIISITAGTKPHTPHSGALHGSMFPLVEQRQTLYGQEELT